MLAQNKEFITECNFRKLTLCLCHKVLSSIILTSIQISLKDLYVKHGQSIVNHENYILFQDYLSVS